MTIASDSRRINCFPLNAWTILAANVADVGTLKFLKAPFATPLNVLHKNLPNIFVVYLFTSKINFFFWDVVTDAAPQ